MRATGAVLALVSASWLFSACGSPSSSTGTSHEAGCSATSPSGPASVPFTVRGLAGKPVPMVSVCVDGHGPYPFVISSGVGNSVIDPGLASTLRLPGAAALAPVLGATCASTAPAVSVQSWSMGGVGLAGQALLTASVPDSGLSPAPLGLIGSDVLGRFGAVRIDYRARQLATAGAEGAAPASSSFVLGDTTHPPTPRLVHGTPQVAVAMTVQSGPSGTVVGAPVAFGSASPVSFTVDSGASESAVIPTEASAAALQLTAGSASAWGVNCQGTVPQVASGPWSLGGTTLPSQALSATAIAGGANQGVKGVLGADVLGRYRSLVIDYQRAYMWLGAG